MIKRIRLLIPFALLLILAIALSGCSAGVGQAVSASDVIAKMRDTMKNTQTAQGTVDLSLTINKEGVKTLAQSMMGSKGGQTEGKGGDPAANLPDSASATLKVWRQQPNKARIEIESASFPNAKGTIAVYDGQKIYVYVASDNTVYSATPSRMDKLPDAVKEVLDGSGVDEYLDKIVAASDIKLVGNEQVAGHDAYKLEATYKPDAADTLGIPKAAQMQVGTIIKDLHATLWIDKDRSIPLKLTLSHPNLGSFTYIATNLDLNQPIDASQFVLQVPTGAKTVDLDAKAAKDEGFHESVTLQEARDLAKHAGWKLLEPGYVPDGVKLTQVLQIHNQTATPGNGFTLYYYSQAANFALSEERTPTNAAAGWCPDHGDIKNLTVRGAKAVACPSGDWSKKVTLTWQEKDSGVIVAIHGGLSLDEAVKIAKSLQ